MKTVDTVKYFENISGEMSKNRDKLIELDAVFGDGDLGVTMPISQKRKKKLILESTL